MGSSELVMMKAIIFLVLFASFSAQTYGKPWGLNSTNANIIPKSGGCAEIPSWMMNSDRVIGGQYATSPIPWQAHLQKGCGAVILDAKTILSAGHCFNPAQESTTVEIRVGSVYRSSGGQVRDGGQLIWNKYPGQEFNP